MRILGIDPGTLRLGYGVIECAGGGAGKVQYVECGVISASARHARAARLAEIGRGLRELMTELRPDAVIDWMGPLDSAQHAHGVGSPEAKAALQAIDRSLARTIATMQALVGGRK